VSLVATFAWQLVQVLAMTVVWVPCASWQVTQAVLAPCFTSTLAWQPVQDEAAAPGS
jgi:hypothetical protein